MSFPLRDYQCAIVRFIQENPRCNVFSGMGTGKSRATLTALDQLSLIEDVFPLLVIAPLRVATTTWPDEVKKWKDLRHLKVSVVTGSAQERKIALLNTADIYCTNYEVAPWLVEHLGSGWPFRTVVADEASKLKGFRLRQGTQRAGALAGVAHAKVSRWVNLTGTPCGNGLGGLWGIQWFIDAGTRLGRTHTAFTDRWFRPSYDGYGIEPLPHAQEEIQEKLRDICITITAADYMDLPPLVENTIFVDLPPKARMIYRDMEREMFAQIGEHGVEAFNAAAKTNKCLQLANGAAYVNDAGTFEEVHQAKLDALEDIIEEAAGAPVLVSHQFRSDLARILKRFKSARHLDKNPQTIRDWNAGKVPILVAHPASAGHGLSLQDGGNILAYFSSGWDLEHDMQIIERIGPTRQAQSGHNREVYVHRIVARDTVDEMVAERRAGKKSVQQILLDAMKRKASNA